MPRVTPMQLYLYDVKTTGRLRLMVKLHNNSMLKILLILCFGFTLLLSQASKMHMHLELDNHAISSGHGHANTHVAGIHPESTPHDFNLTNHQNNHSTSAVDISAEKLQNKTNLLNLLVLIWLFFCLFLYSPRLRSVARLALSIIPFTSRYYLLQPPLRAPPIK